MFLEVDSKKNDKVKKKKREKFILCIFVESIE